MTTDEPDFSRTLSSLARQIDERGIALQEVKEGNCQILARMDQFQEQISERLDQFADQLSSKIDLFQASISERLDQFADQLSDKIDQSHAQLSERIDQSQAQANSRFDRLFMALVGTGTGIVVAQAGVIITLLLR